MTEITIPNQTDIEVIDGPSVTYPTQVNRSEWTGARKVLGVAGAERWSASFAIGPIATELNERQWRVFLASLRGQENFFKWVMPCQTPPGSKPTVDTGAAVGYTLPLTGMPLSQTILSAGEFMTVPLPSGHDRLVMLTADLVSDGSGDATATFEPALNEVAVAATTVETVDPYLPLSLVTPRAGFGYVDGVGTTVIDCEESF